MIHILVDILSKKLKSDVDPLPAELTIENRNVISGISIRANTVGSVWPLLLLEK